VQDEAAPCARAVRDRGGRRAAGGWTGAIGIRATLGDGSIGGGAFMDCRMRLLVTNMGTALRRNRP